MVREIRATPRPYKPAQPACDSWSCISLQAIPLSPTLSQPRGLALQEISANKSKIPAPSFQSLTDSFFTLFHSCRNNSFICTVFRKRPGDTHPSPQNVQYISGSIQSKRLTPPALTER